MGSQGVTLVELYALKKRLEGYSNNANDVKNCNSFASVLLLLRVQHDIFFVVVF